MATDDFRFPHTNRTFAAVARSAGYNNMMHLYYVICIGSHRCTSVNDDRRPRVFLVYPHWYIIWRTYYLCVFWHTFYVFSVFRHVYGCLHFIVYYIAVSAAYVSVRSLARSVTVRSCARLVLCYIIIIITMTTVPRYSRPLQRCRWARWITA